MPELASRIRAKYPGVYDDLDDAALETKVRAKYPGVYDDLASPTETPKTPLSEKLASAAPIVGGMVGGLAGGVPGAALGGAAGSGYGQLIKHAGELPGAVADVARNLVSNPRETLAGGMAGMAQGAADAGISGAIQGASEGAGRLIGAGLKAAAPRLYQSVLKPSMKLREDFPTVVQDAINSGIGIGERGIEKAGKLIAGTSKQVDDKLALMQRAGAAPVDMKQVVGQLVRTEQKVGQEPLRAQKLGQIADMRAQLLAENPNPIPLTQAQSMKQAAQRVASQGYRQIDSGADINRVPLDVNMDVAAGLREAIEQRVPAVAGLNQQTQSLMGVQRALEAAQGRIQNNQPIGMNALIASGVGAGAYGASGDAGTGSMAALSILALTNPWLASRLAIGADRLAPAVAQAPNLGRAALLAQLGGDQ